MSETHNAESVRVRFVVSMDARGDEVRELDRIFRLLRDWYEGRHLSVGVQTTTLNDGGETD